MHATVVDSERQIVTIDRFLSPEECDALIAWTDATGYEAASITTRAGVRMARDVRNNRRVIADDPARAKALWERVAPFVPGVRPGWNAVGLNERLRFYRYEFGQKFDWHRDGAFVRTPDERSRLTFMVYLNDDFGGGETTFEDRVEVVPERGMALLFAHEANHTGAVVTRGRKYVLRSDVMFARVAPPA